MLTEKMTEYISEQELFTYDDTIGAAVSGGADSVAMLLCLKKAGYNVTALHVEHGIRGEESLCDMRLVERLCEKIGVPLLKKRVFVPQNMLSGESEESAARRLRYEFFEEASKTHGLKYIAVAHHIEDAAETFVFNLLRGSGLTGLSSMKPKREPNIVRPLLFATRGDIEAFLKDEGIAYATDSTNADTDYSRNYIRNVIMPALCKINPRSCESIVRASGLIGEEDAALNEIASAELARISRRENDCVYVDISALLSLNKAVARRVLRIALASVGSINDVELAHIEAIYALCSAGTGKRYELGERFFAQVSYNSLKISAKKGIIKKYGPVPLNIDGATDIWCGRLECSPCEDAAFTSPRSLIQTVNADMLRGAVIRTRRAGDRFKPFSSGEKKLKDFLIDAKVPRDERDNLPLIAKDGEILWVVGYAISDKLRVDNDTPCKLRIKFINEAEEQ